MPFLAYETGVEFSTLHLIGSTRIREAPLPVSLRSSPPQKVATLMTEHRMSVSVTAGSARTVESPASLTALDASPPYERTLTQVM